MKLFVTDLDGTFLDSNHSVVPRAVPLIQKMQQQGCAFAVCTGRNIESIDGIFNETGLSFPKIGLNGALAVDENGKVLFSKGLDMKDLEILMSYAKRYDIPFSLYSADTTYSPDPKCVYRKIAEVWSVKKESVIEDPEKLYQEVFETNLITQIEDIRDLKDTILKAEYHPQNQEISDMLYLLFEEMPFVDVSTSGYQNIEITHIEAQKGLALEAYCKYKNINKEEVVVVGDSYNDISMLSRFPNSYAMGQADKQIKNVANFVTKTNEEEGSVALIEAIVEGKL